MNKILILSERLDFHGLAVQWGLAKLGVRADWWDRSLFPSKEQLSVAVGGKLTAPRLTTRGSELDIGPSAYKTIWNRRGRAPTVDKSLHAADQVVAKAESRFFLGGLMGLLETNNSNALWVNRLAAGEHANEKLGQLVAARKVGFDVPSTLMSNDPFEIRAFYKAHVGQIIAKQHIPFSWRSEDGSLAVPGTSVVTAEMLTHDFPLVGAPMIYQEFLDIDHEVRITAFGRTAFAIRRVRVGERAGNIRDIKWEETASYEYPLSEHLSGKCYTFMAEMDLNYATFDIAVTKDGRELFLECNESGQFLFLEEEAPALRLVDAFCQFLASGDPLFMYKKPFEGITLADFRETDIANDFITAAVDHLKDSKTFSPFELSE